MAKQDKAFEFGPFRLDVRERRLTRDGHALPLRGRVFDTLYALVSRHGSLVTKDELMAIIWPDSVVEETNLNHNICVLRRALGEKDNGHKYVETVPRQGYRFVAEVKALDGPGGYSFPHDREMREAVPPPIQPPAEWQSPSQAPDRKQPMLQATGSRWYKPRRVIFLLAASVLFVVGYFGVEQAGFRRRSADSRLMLAVLPFENLTGDSSQNYIADGFSHEILSQLGRWNIARIGVIARTTAGGYQGTHKSIAEIGRELGVDYIVEGSVRRNGDHYRITVMLIRVDNQAQLWAANYSRVLDDATALQIEVAEMIAKQIGRTVGVEPEPGYRIEYPQSKDTWPYGSESSVAWVCP